MGPDLTWAYFWLAFDPGTFWPEEIFFDPKVKNWKIFQIRTQTINGSPDPTWVKNFWPGPITNMYCLINVNQKLSDTFLVKYLIT